MKIIRFGKWNIYDPDVSFFGRIGYFIHGSPSIALFFQSHYFRKYIEKIINNKTKSILDIGCGGGDYSFYFAEKYQNLQIDAIDISREGIEKIKRIQMNVPFYNVNFFVSDLEKFRGGGRSTILFFSSILLMK